MILQIIYLSVQINKQMNFSKSPIKPPTKTHSSVTPRSVVPSNKSKTKGQIRSNTRRRTQPNMEVYNSQAYKNVLTKLQSKSTIYSFLDLASKYIKLTDKYAQKYSNLSPQDEKDKQEWYQLSKSLLKDGSFIKHYCKLLTLNDPSQANQIRKYFYDNYKDRICEKKQYFQKYFKEEIHAEMEETFSKSLKKREAMNQSARKKAQSYRKKVVSSQKIYVECQNKYSQNKNQEEFSCKNEEKQCSIVTGSFYQPNGDDQKIFESPSKQSDLEDPDTSAPNFRHITSRRKIPQKQDESISPQLHSPSGSQQISNKRINILKSPSNSQHLGLNIKFKNDMMGYSSLKQTHESAKNDQKQQQLKPYSDQMTQKHKREEQNTGPVRRSQFKKVFHQIQRQHFLDIKPGMIQKLSQQDQQLLTYFPNVTKIGQKKYIQNMTSFVGGKFNGKTLMKCYVKDLYKFQEPEYQAVYLTEKTQRASPIFDKRIDETVEVILVDEVPSEPVVLNSMYRSTFGRM